MELVFAKLPNWLEGQMRNLNCHSYAELTEAIIRHLGNFKAKNEMYHKKEQYQPAKGDRRYEKEPYLQRGRGHYERPEAKGDDSPSGKGVPLPYTKDLRTIQCFKGGRYHISRKLHIFF